MENLKNEGISNYKNTYKVVKSGDVILDATLHYGRTIDGSWLTKNSLESNKYILATIHRAENTNSVEILSRLISALDKISKECYKVVWPMHPRTRAIINNNSNLNNQVKKSDIKIISPLGYLDMICAEKNCCLVLTDSGGVQREAFFNKKLCVTMRNETEWTELVDIGWNKIAGLDPENIILSVKQMLCVDSEKLVYPDLYGCGNAGVIIVKELANL